MLASTTLVSIGYTNVICRQKSAKLWYTLEGRVYCEMGGGTKQDLFLHILMHWTLPNHLYKVTFEQTWWIYRKRFARWDSNELRSRRRNPKGCTANDAYIEETHHNNVPTA